LNNLLVGVLGNAGLALMDLPPHSPATKHVERIEEVGKRVAKLLQKLLAYSGMGRLVVRPIDVSELIQGLARSMESAVSEKAQLRFELESGLPQVDADPAELKRVVRNLVENASEALGDEGGLVVVRTGVRKETRSDLARYWPRGDRAGGTYVYLEVSDTGCGMKAESIPQVFDPFFTTKFAGRGLGLCEVLGIVRAHRGAIRLESEPGLGTTVRVLLPTPGGLVAGPERDGTKRELER
jgi:signal transduction histidine kinase